MRYYDYAVKNREEDGEKNMHVSNILGRKTHTKSWTVDTVEDCVSENGIMMMNLRMLMLWWSGRNIL